MTPPDRSSTLTPQPSRHFWTCRLSLTLLSSALAAACYEPPAVAPLAWVAVVPLLVALRGASATTVRTLCFVWGLAFYGLGLAWLTRIFGTAAVGLWAVLAATMWAFGLCFALLQQRYGYRRAVIFAPVLWVAVDLFRSELWYFRFPWLQLGFSQVECPAILQAASVVGVYGLTLLIVAVNAVVALTILRWGPRAGAMLAGAVLLVSALLGGGPLREPHAAHRFAAAAVQTERSDLDMNLRLSEGLGPGVDLIAWPEYSLLEYPLDDPALLARLQALARRQRAVLVVGCKEHIAGAPPEVFHNSALVIGPQGRVLGSYHKHYPVQFFNDGQRGRGWPTFATPVGRMGVAICYDMDFAPVFRKLVNAGAEFLVVPTYDALDWTARQHLQHSAMARARAVEVRRWVVRPASSGVSQINDPRGNLRRSLEVGEEGVVVGEIEALTGRSLYVRGGWVLPYVCAGLTAFLVGWSAVGGLRRRALLRRQQEQPALPGVE